jgi:hypothetical protein
LVDLRSTGRLDLITGSMPGRLYLFRRNADGSFASRETVQGFDGKSLDAGSMTCVFAFDWFGTGKMDLVVGTVHGAVTVCKNAGGTEPKFGPPQPILLKDGSPLKIPTGDAAPVVADWDGDGLPDLVVGAGDGSVVWFMNVGTRTAPKFDSAKLLVPPSKAYPSGQPKPGEWGTHAKPCVVDWDGNGRLNLLVGDRNAYFEGKPAQTADEKAAEMAADDALPKLREQWASAFKQYREAQVVPALETPKEKAEREEKVESLRRLVTRLKDEIVAVQDVQDRHKGGYQYHGYVWLFKRQPAAPKGK